jgi:hypothetical protein
MQSRLLKLVVVGLSSLLLGVFHNQSYAQNIKPDHSMPPISNVNVFVSEGYGVVPYIYQSSIGYYFKTEGSADLKAFDLPLNIRYSFSDINRNSSISNYINVSFDIKKYKEQKIERIKAKKDSLVSQIASLDEKRQKLLKQQLATDYALKNPNLKSFFPDTLRSDISSPIISDSIKNTTTGNPLSIYRDSLNGFTTNKIDPKSALSNRDSLNRVKNEIEESIALIEKKKAQLEKAGGIINYDTSGYITNRLNKPDLLSSIQKFEIGRSNPNYSQFLIANTSLKGISFEAQANNVYLAGGVGKVVTNYSYNRNLQPSNPFAFKNIYDFININDVEESNKVISLKGGIGRKNETHIYFGGLYGKGKAVNTANQVTGVNSDLDRNIVWEADGRLNVSKAISIESAYAWSRIENDFTSGNSIKQPAQNLRSAASGRINFSIQKYKLKGNGSVKYTGPFFRSLGLGFLSSDQIIYELRATKAINRKFKVSGYYRDTKNNLSGLAGVTIRTVSYQLGGDYRLFKNWQLHGDYMPTKIYTNSLNEHSDNSNTVYNVGLNGMYTIVKQNISSGLNYNHTITNFNNITSIFETFNLNFGANISKDINVNLNVNYLRQTSQAEVLPDTKSLELGATGNIKSRIKLSGALRINEMYGNPEYGGSAKLTYMLSRFINISGIAERNTLSQSVDLNSGPISQYPYNFQIQLHLHL